MILDIKTDLLLPCKCGFKPDHFSMAYGSTPFSVWCPQCQSGVAGVGGDQENIVAWWNLHGRFARRQFRPYTQTPPKGYVHDPACDLPTGFAARIPSLWAGNAVNAQNCSQEPK